MQLNPFLIAIVIVVLLGGLGLAKLQTSRASKATLAQTDERVVADGEGAIRVVPLPMGKRYQNPWSPELEVAFQQRANEAIHKLSGRKSYGNTAFENEKRSYPLAMADFFAGNRDRALDFLQQEDDDAEGNAHTLGIDLYSSFTLKGQMRKYFFFGQYLDPGYKQRMYAAARIWTEVDPLSRHLPHQRQFYAGSKDRCSTWVDCRNTDNLRAMRETSVYLMAEETGNKATRQLYKQRLQRYVWALYNIGMGEWDSENYHGHNITAYVNLYDFAKDPEVRLLGKAALDWFYAAGALKYWRGGFGGPSKRDYNEGNQVWKAKATSELGLYFGDSPQSNPAPYHDLVHLVSSHYRPPEAVIALARRQFPKPIELLNAKPTYETWLPGGEDAPAFYETLYFGHSFQMGTLPQGSGGDWNGFKLMAFNACRGVDYLVASTGKNPACMSTQSIGGDNIAQYRNLVLWLNCKGIHCKGEVPFQFFLPKTVEWRSWQDMVFLQYEQTWLVLHPINLTFTGIDDDATEKIATLYPDDQIATAWGTGSFSGFALEVGEAETHGSFEQFQDRVLSSARLDLQQLDRGIALYQGTTGEMVKLQYQQGGGLPRVWRNGVLVEWRDRTQLYQPADGSQTPISLGWKQGKLQVEAGGKRFVGQLTPQRTYRFSNRQVT